MERQAFCGLVPAISILLLLVRAMSIVLHIVNICES